MKVKGKTKDEIREWVNKFFDTKEYWKGKLKKVGIDYSQVVIHKEEVYVEIVQQSSSLLLQVCVKRPQGIQVIKKAVLKGLKEGTIKAWDKTGLMMWLQGKVQKEPFITGGIMRWFHNYGKAKQIGQFHY